MENLFKILDWDPIPNHLIYKTEEEIKKRFKNESPFKTIRVYKIDDNNFLDFLQPFFSFDLKDPKNHCCYQVIEEGFPVHIDQRRTVVYNYLIDTGGTDVYTTWYENDKTTEIFKTKIPALTWHRLYVGSNHTVVGKQKTDRLALTVFEET